MSAVNAQSPEVFFHNSENRRRGTRYWRPPTERRTRVIRVVLRGAGRGDAADVGLTLKNAHSLRIDGSRGIDFKAG